MKVLFILDVYKPKIWWVERLFENYINELSLIGHKSIIVTSRFRPDLEKYVKENDNVEIYRFWHNRFDFMFFCLFKWYSLAKQCDLIHTSTYNSAIPAWIIWLFARKKVILTVHEVYAKLWYKFMWIKWFFFKLFETIIFVLPFYRYICVSNYTKNSLRLLYWIEDTKLITNYNWIDYSIWNKDNFNKNDINKIRIEYKLEWKFSILFYGRPWISKWLEYLLLAIPWIIKQIPNAHFFLIVATDETKRFEYITNLIRSLNIEDSQYTLIPSIKDHSVLWNYILANNLVIVPSLAEWFWFCAAEVCSLDKELLVTNVGSLPEVVSGKINFIEPSNPEEIIKWIIKFFNNEYSTIEKKEFLWEDNVSKTIWLYNSLINK